MPNASWLFSLWRSQSSSDDDDDLPTRQLMRPPPIASRAYKSILECLATSCLM